MNFANLITLSRIVLIIPILILSYLGEELKFFAAILFVIASLSDFLDGYIARKTNTATELGALLDLLSDKLLVSLVLVWIIFLDPRLIITIPSIIIISRELIISSIRQFLKQKKESITIKVSYAGKIKTTFQFIAISLIIYSLGTDSVINYLAISLLWISAFLSVLSLISYIISWKEVFDFNIK